MMGKKDLEIAMTRSRDHGMLEKLHAASHGEAITSLLPKVFIMSGYVERRTSYFRNSFVMGLRLRSIWPCLELWSGVYISLRPLLNDLKNLNPNSSQIHASY